MPHPYWGQIRVTPIPRDVTTPLPGGLLFVWLQVFLFRVIYSIIIITVVITGAIFSAHFVYRELELVIALSCLPSIQEGGFSRVWFPISCNCATTIK